MKLDDIGFPAITEERAKTASTTSRLQRCELIATDACNLKCTYCKGLSSKYGTTISKNNAEHIISGWIDHGLQHASFSGGEPMCSPYIETFVKMLSDGGVPFISLSTNGTFPVEKYAKLIELGATHFSISIDGRNPYIADKMAGVDGAWKKVVKSITYLSQHSYVTASTVFNKDNVDDSANIIKFIHSLGVADIRFSSATQFNRLIPALELVPEDILKVHPILRFRIGNILKGINMRGISPKRCWLPLDDMVVSNTLHFPCTMQMREGGCHIGSIIGEGGSIKTMKEIRNERGAWCKSHDCFKDSICNKYCMDFIIAYNKTVEKNKQQS